MTASEYTAYTIWRRPRVLLSPAQMAYVQHKAKQLGIAWDAYIGGLLIFAIDDAMARDRKETVHVYYDSQGREIEEADVR